MKTIALISQKGGAGKTTLTAGLAVAAVATGLRVVAVDLDFQGSLVEWARRRQGALEGLDVRRFDPAGGVAIADALAAIAPDYDLALLDCPGKHDDSVAAAMRAADLLLIPTRPAAMDLAATRTTVHSAVTLKRPFAFILNQCVTTPRNPRAGQVAAGLGALGEVATPFLCQRADYQDAYSVGQGVTEFDPAGRAAGEVRALWTWIARKLEGAPQWTTANANAPARN